ncbi:TetR/AcrR family transcriptional regulator [Streptomyces sulphureus]|uniref:TetR/AcrR family transcriptional regulator n=1 Tax=Streptomyces sulphureus TaxID=47758 RepID=UPI000372E905|nr:TetR/AcrR family transcriptional regulator [Streptomyces sulphureus]
MTAPAGPRARYREQVREEIRAAALRQVAESGVQGIALNSIARRIGMSGPALYRYFAGRDELLHDLVRSAYDDIGRAINAVPRQQDPRATLLALGRAYLDWAVGEPHRYLLIQGPPAPGYASPADTVERARTAMGPFVAVFAEGEPTAQVQPVADEMRTWMQTDTAAVDWLRAHTALDPQAPRAAGALAGTVLAWSHLHGTVSLEVTGQYTGMGHRAATLLGSQLRMLADAFRLP